LVNNEREIPRTMTSLVIQSKAIKQRAIIDALEKHNCPYHLAHSIEEAVKTLHENKGNYHSIILCEESLLKQGGEWLKPFSKDSILQDIPLIISRKSDKGERISLPNHIGTYYWLYFPFAGLSLYSTLQSAESDFKQRQSLRREIHSRESVIGSITRGTFRIKTFEQAEALTTMLSLACPEPDRIAFGLFELLANGIEHGNLAIGHENKIKLIAAGQRREEIERRLKMPEYEDLYVEIQFERESDLVSFKISDMGKGFDIKETLEMDLSLNQMACGRGIALAKATSFDYLEYIGEGNIVLAVAKFDPAVIE